MAKSIILFANSPTYGYIMSGYTNSILGSVGPIAPYYDDFIIGGGRVMSCNTYAGSSFVYYYNPGFSTALAGSFRVTDDTYTIAYSNGNVITCDLAKNYIYIHNGLSSTITGSFAAPGSNVLDVLSITVANGNLITARCPAYFGSTYLYVHNGITSSITGSYPISADDETDVDYMTFDGTNLLHWIYYEGITNVSHVYVHSGTTSTITGSYSTTSPKYLGMKGMGAYSPSPIGVVNIQNAGNTIPLSLITTTDANLYTGDQTVRVALNGSVYCANVGSTTDADVSALRIQTPKGLKSWIGSVA
ncbi:hypothetical protein KKE60_05820 [Patescibacteria group bacterium]|nr:hypothetical protein [Patescibacteria group bacterium]